MKSRKYQIGRVCLILLSLSFISIISFSQKKLFCYGSPVKAFIMFPRGYSSKYLRQTAVKSFEAYSSNFIQMTDSIMGITSPIIPSLKKHQMQPRIVIQRRRFLFFKQNYLIIYRFAYLEYKGDYYAIPREVDDMVYELFDNDKSYSFSLRQ